MLARFWAKYDGGGVHPADARYINASNSLRWGLAAARRRQKIFENDPSLHGMLHLGITPQPFIGNIETATVYVLMANPGLSISDYEDDFENRSHMEASEANLRQRDVGFYPILPASLRTGAGRYWRARFGSLQADLTRRLGISPDSAWEILVKEVAVVESGPYHSKVFPGSWVDRLPSSRAARRFVHRCILPRADAGDAIVLVLRRAAFWRISEQAQNVIRRPPKHAQLVNLFAAERQAMVDVLVAKRSTSAVRCA